MPLNIENVAPDRGHDTEFLGNVKNGDGRSADTDVDSRVHEAIAETLICEYEWCKVVRHFNQRRGAGV